MARRRVFRTRAKCPGISTNIGKHALSTAIGITQLRSQMRGRNVGLEKSSSEVNITLDGTVVGQLDPVIGVQVALAIERGQPFSAVIEDASTMYDHKLTPTGAHLDIKVEYVLDKGQPAIEAPTCWRGVESPHELSHAPRSFFTKVAGVTFEGRQRIVARCSVGESLMLVRDPNESHDKGAIKVSICLPRRNEDDNTGTRLQRQVERLSGLDRNDWIRGPRDLVS